MSVEYLYSLEHFGIKFGLDNMNAIVSRLGHPERAFRAVHIAGTNGKGSVTAMVDAGLRAAGCRSARYTSPHLVDLTERFVIDGKPVSTPCMLRAIDEVREAVEALRRDGTLDVHPTFFEVTTSVAFELFRRAGVDIAVIEVGLGGRLDATNVVHPIATAITSIALDHQQYLGSTVREIAFEKAGIIKDGVPVVVGDVPREAEAVIEDVAREHRAPIVRARAADVDHRPVALRGAHQRGNAAVAMELLRIVDSPLCRISEQAIDEGLAQVDWPGRLDWRRLAGGRELLLDAAHNPAGAKSLARYLGGGPVPMPRMPLVFGVMTDKDVSGMFAELLPFVSSLIVTRAATPRSADPEVLVATAHRVAPDLPISQAHARSEALELAWRQSSRIVVAGSIFLIGDVMKELGLH